jgi:hypothetical protein
MRAKLISKFDNCLFPLECQLPIDKWVLLLEPVPILDRLCELVNVTVSEEARTELHRDPSIFKLVDSDIVEISAQVKHMNTVDYAEVGHFVIKNFDTQGMALSLLAAKKKVQKQECLRLLKLSSVKFMSALRSSPDSFMALYQWALVLTKQAELSNASQTEILWENAVARFKDAIALKPSFEVCPTLSCSYHTRRRI